VKQPINVTATVTLFVPEIKIVHSATNQKYRVPMMRDHQKQINFSRSRLLPMCCDYLNKIYSLQLLAHLRENTYNFFIIK
jgi:hypothetical protein